MLEATLYNGRSTAAPRPTYLEVPSNEFITGSALSTLVGLDAQAARGTLMTTADTEPWMLINDSGRILAIPKKPLRYKFGYRAAQNAKLITGNTTVTIAECVWKVTLPTGVATTSDWMRYMGGVVAGSVATTRWASLSYDDLGIGDANATGLGVTTYIRETYNSSQYYTRGNKNNYAFGPTNQNMDNAFNSTGWRPFLELVSGEQPWV